MITFVRYINAVTTDSSSSKTVGWPLAITNISVGTFHCVCKG